MRAEHLVAEVRAAGVRLFVDRGRLKADPPGQLPNDLRTAIQAAKAAVVAVLERAMAPDACSECGTYDWRLALVDTAGNRTCAACATGLTALRRNGVAI